MRALPARRRLAGMTGVRVERAVRAAMATVAVAVCAMAAHVAAADAATYSGRFTCNDRGTVVGMPGARVEIWDRGFNILDQPPPEITGRVFARGFTDEDGNFSISGPSLDALVFARVVFHDGYDVSLNDWATPWDWANDTQRVQARNGDVRFPEVELVRERQAMGSPRCAVFRGVHEARVAYAQEIGADVPNHAREIGWNYPNAATFGHPPGVPFTAGTGIKWPEDWPVGAAGGDWDVALHEFGHSIRHGFDGGLIHFLGDVLAFDYLNQHGPCARFNEGFAFNEGWADYWARQTADPGCFPRDDYAVEGRVAQALKELELRCAGGDRRIMVGLLARTPGRIHSFRQFRDLLGCPVPATPPPVEAPPAPTPPPPPPPRVPGATTVTTLDHQIAALIPRLRDARKKSAIRRVVLEAQLATLRRQRREVAYIASKAGRAQLRRLGLRAGLRLLSRRRVRLARAIETIEVRMARELVSVTAGRPGLGPIAAGARRYLTALGPMGGPPMRMSLPVVDPPRYLPLAPLPTPTPAAPQPEPTPSPQPQPQPTPAPQPQPTPQPPPAKTASAIALTCPGSGKVKGTVAWSGALTPALATTITVAITDPGGEIATSSTVSDASGAFGGSFDTTSAGTWRVTASWPGDATHTASSGTCTVAVS